MGRIRSAVAARSVPRAIPGPTRSMQDREYHIVAPERLSGPDEPGVRAGGEER